jgi:hypothetical protein
MESSADRPSRVNPLRRPRWVTGALLLAVGIAFGLQTATIWISAVPDFDTDELILLWSLGVAPRSDNAHPMCLFIWSISTLSSIIGSALIGWRIAITLAMAAGCVTLFVLTRRFARSTPTGLLLCLAYLLSPCMSDLSARAEENYCNHAPFLFTIYLLWRIQDPPGGVPGEGPGSASTDHRAGRAVDTLLGVSALRRGLPRPGAGWKDRAAGSEQIPRGNAPRGRDRAGRRAARWLSGGSSPPPCGSAQGNSEAGWKPRPP